MAANAGSQSSADRKLAERRARRAAMQEVFDALAAHYLSLPKVERRPMFGSYGLVREGKFFAFVGRAGDVVLKLPEAQATELVARGEASAVRAGRNPTREWVSVPLLASGATERWSALLADAYHYADSAG